MFKEIIPEKEEIVKDELLSRHWKEWFMFCFDDGTRKIVFVDADCVIVYNPIGDMKLYTGFDNTATLFDILKTYTLEKIYKIHNVTVDVEYSF